MCRISKEEFQLALYHDTKSIHDTQGREYFAVEKKSETTKTFVARRDNKDYLFYEDGTSHSYSEIGEEYRHFRPVRKGDKWVFFDVINRKTCWSISNGYTFANGEKLDRKFNYDCYTIRTTDGKFRLFFYDRKGRKIHKKDHLFDSIYENEKRYIIGRINGVYLVYYHCYRQPLPILSGRYVENPVRDASYLIAKNLDNNFCLIRNGKEIVNHTWGSAFRFYNDKKYIFNLSGNSTSWKVYDGSGIPLPIDWENLTIDDNFNMTADTGGRRNVSVQISDIDAQLEKLKRLSEELSGSKNIGTSKSDALIDHDSEIQLEEKPKDMAAESASNHSSFQDIIETIQSKNNIPEHIKFFAVSSSKPHISTDLYLKYSRKRTHLSAGDNILWLYDTHIIIITKVKVNKALSVCYYRELDRKLQFQGRRSFEEVNITVSDETELINEILKLEGKYNQKEPHKPKELELEEPQIEEKESNISELPSGLETTPVRTTLSDSSEITELPWSEVLNQLTDQKRFLFMMEYFNGISFSGLSSQKSFEICRLKFCGIQSEEQNTSESDVSTLEETPPADNFDQLEPDNRECDEMPAYIMYRYHEYRVGDVLELNKKKDRMIFKDRDSTSVFVVHERNENGKYIIEGVGGKVQTFRPENVNTALKERKTPIAIIQKLEDGKYKIVDLVRYVDYKVVRNNDEERIKFTLLRLSYKPLLET